MSAEQGCHNCVHRYGMWREFWKCSRTGYFTETEMRYGGECASGQELRLWLPRPTLLRRMFPLSKAAA